MIQESFLKTDLATARSRRCPFPGPQHKLECLATVSFSHLEIYEKVISDFLDLRMLFSFCFNILFFKS